MSCRSDYVRREREKVPLFSPKVPAHTHTLTHSYILRLWSSSSDWDGGKTSGLAIFYLLTFFSCFWRLTFSFSGFVIWPREKKEFMSCQRQRALTPMRSVLNHILQQKYKDNVGRVWIFLTLCEICSSFCNPTSFSLEEDFQKVFFFFFPMHFLPSTSSSSSHFEKASPPTHTYVWYN